MRGPEEEEQRSKSRQTVHKVKKVPFHRPERARTHAHNIKMLQDEERNPILHLMFGEFKHELEDPSVFLHL